MNTAEALALAASIVALRAEIEGLEGQYKPRLDALADETKAYRAQRDEQIAPLKERMDGLRAELGGWLAGDPDGNLRDGERIVATLASGKAAVNVTDPALVPAEYCSPDKAKIEAAFRLGKSVPGAELIKPRILKVL